MKKIVNKYTIITASFLALGVGVYFAYNAYDKARKLKNSKKLPYES